MKLYAGRFPFEEPEGDGSFWGIIDVLTLMLVFFIVMYVQESPEAGPVAKSPAVDLAVAVPQPGVSPEISQAVQRHLDGLLGNGFYISASGQSLTLVLEEQLSFSSGEAMLATDSVAILDRVASLILEENGYDVVISGHSEEGERRFRHGYSEGLASGERPGVLRNRGAGQWACASVAEIRNRYEGTFALLNISLRLFMPFLLSI